MSEKKAVPMQAVLVYNLSEKTYSIHSLVPIELGKTYDDPLIIFHGEHFYTRGDLISDIAAKSLPDLALMLYQWLNRQGMSGTRYQLQIVGLDYYIPSANQADKVICREGNESEVGQLLHYLQRHIAREQSA